VLLREQWTYPLLHLYRLVFAGMDALPPNILDALKIVRSGLRSAPPRQH
jgi:hypothetical protein